MKNLQNIIKGILSVAVFFMATQISVAQEIVPVISTNEVQTEIMEKKEATKKVEIRAQMVSPVDFTVEPNTSVTDPANWEQAGLEECHNGPNLCGITFDEDMYPLDSGKPSILVLNIVNTNWSSTPDGGQIGSTGIYVYRRN